MVNKMAEDNPDQYRTFWKSFGQVIKEGPSEDHENKDKIAELFRFSSTRHNNDNQEISLKEYVNKMKKDQKYIYFVTAESFNAAKNNPHLEIFRKKDIEVILMYDRVDEWMTSHLNEFDGKTLKSISKGDLDLGELESNEDKKEQEKVGKDFEPVVKQMKEILKDKVEEVRITKRLTESPSCVVVNDHGMSMHLQKMMSDSGQTMMAGTNGKPILEINPDHGFIKKLKEEQDDEKFADCSNILLQQALLTEGARLDDPAGFIRLTNKYLIM
jgi:molecular chaperone HtpG